MKEEVHVSAIWITSLSITLVILKYANYLLLISLSRTNNCQPGTAKYMLNTYLEASEFINFFYIIGHFGLEGM